MGVDISGGICIGAWARDIPEEAYEEFGSLYDFQEEEGLDRMSPWYDADVMDCFIGIRVADVYSINELDARIIGWKVTAEKLQAKLKTNISIVGMQNVW